jgi:L-fuculose-phosphate aldolase
LSIGSDEQALRLAIVETALAMNAQGINRGKSGNVSARFSSRDLDGFLVTPTGLLRSHDAGRYRADDPEGEARGKRLPSSEWRFHRDIYRTGPMRARSCTPHSPFATTLALPGRGHSRVPLHDRVAGGRDIRCADYATFGTQALSDHVLAPSRDARVPPRPHME